MVFKPAQATERKARAAVMCRRFVELSRYAAGETLRLARKADSLLRQHGIVL
jgi:hypothetical protein